MSGGRAPGRHLPPRRSRSLPGDLHAWCPQPVGSCVICVTQRSRRYVSRPMAKMRLDTLLHQRGLFESRARAAASVMAGEVRLGTDGARAAKPGQLVAEDVALAVDERPRFVSRGGIKLANALDATGVDPPGRRCLDVGASTGGFTDCLLQRGAAHVVALDVAYGELDWALRTDERVTVHRARERAGAGGRRPAVRARPDRRRRRRSSRWRRCCRRCWPAPRRASTRWRWSSRSSRSAASGSARAASCASRRTAARALVAVATAASDARRRRCSASRPSGLPGPKGNRETFVWLAEAGRAGALDRPRGRGRGGGGLTCRRATVTVVTPRAPGAGRSGAARR